MSFNTTETYSNSDDNVNEGALTVLFGIGSSIENVSLTGGSVQQMWNWTRVLKFAGLQVQPSDLI